MTAMVSMKDIAEVCGVSVATVSKALNDHSDISERTKVRIRQTAKEMGYFPNSAAQALKTNRTYNIGILFGDETKRGLTHDYFCSILDSFKQTAERRGYDITFINCSKRGKNRMSYLEHAMYRGFDGVAIAFINFMDPEVVSLIRSDLPVVTIDHMFDNRISIVSDNVAGMNRLVNHVYEKGHRKIAYIYGNASSVTQNRLTSFYKTTKDLGLDIPEDYIRQGAYKDVKLSYQRTLELLELPDPPTCILYPDDFASFGGINAIRSKGLHVPDDISVVGYDGIQAVRYLLPRLTTYRQNTEQIGHDAAKKLIGLIEEPKATLVEQLLIKGTFCAGNTVKDIR
jgi:LacI family transcriptional regulator/LacI family purine nucleotide synthesis repressor